MNKTEMDPLGGFNLTRENLTSSVPAEMMDDGEMVAFFAFSGGIVIIALLFSLWRVWMDGLGESNCSRAILQFRRTEKCFSMKI